MEGQEFLTEYRAISNKLKKRFLRRPNVSEASDHFRQLGKRLDDTDEPQYAAFCHLATGEANNQAESFHFHPLPAQDVVNKQLGTHLVK